MKTRNQKTDDLVRTAAFLAEHYPDPLPLDATGKSPLDWECHNIAVRDAVAAVVARRERDKLKEHLPKTVGAGVRRQRL